VADETEVDSIRKRLNRSRNLLFQGLSKHLPGKRKLLTNHSLWDNTEPDGPGLGERRIKMPLQSPEFLNIMRSPLKTVGLRRENSG
jgi:hypothetical protein